VPGDTVVFRADVDLRSTPTESAKRITEIQAGNKAVVVDVKGDYFQLGMNGKTGWAIREDIITPAKANKLRKRKRETLSRMEKLRDLRDELQKSGHPLVIEAQFFRKGPKGKIDVGLGGQNISKRTIQSLEAIWQLYSSSGEQISAPTRVEYRNAIAPDEILAARFASIWNREEGTCAELKKLVLSMRSGETKVYDGKILQKIARYGTDVKLSGDCSK